MELKKIATETAPKAIGPYSQAIAFGNILFTSGQIPLDPVNGTIVGETITEQATQVMKNLGEVLKAAGTCYEKAIKISASYDDGYKNIFALSPRPYKVSYSIYNACEHHRRER